MTSRDDGGFADRRRTSPSLRGRPGEQLGAAPPELDTASIRRGFLRACVIGAAAAAVIFTWMLLIGRLDLLHTEGLSGFYDAQAHALLGGHWDIPAGKLGFEAFVIDGKQYMYFGPWPALLRLPIAAVTTSLDGELTQLSMLLAFAVLMVATVRLLWRVRTIMRPDRPLARLEQWAVGVFVLVVGAGSVVLFLASRPVVYHEASLWGVALAIGAFEAALAFVLRPGRGALAWACVLTALSLMSRSSVGLGPLAVLGAVFAARLLVLLADRGDSEAVRSRSPARRLVRVFGLPTDERARGYVAPLAIGIGIVLALYVYVNWVKFGDLFSVPLDRHYTTFIDPIRRKLYADESSLFAAKYIPTDLLAMFRPDAIGLDRLFPFLTFPATATVLGGLTYAALDPSSSIPSSMPFLFLLALVGAVVVFRPRRGRDPEAPSAALLRVFALAGLVGGIASVSLPYINQRYQADWLPLLIVLGAAGLFATLHVLDAFTGHEIRVERTHRRRAGWSTAIVVVGAALALFSVWANFSLALLYQRAHSPFPLNSERAAFVRFQHAIDEKLPGGSGFDVERGDALPRKAAAVGTLFVVGDCEGVYWSDGRNWLPIEQTHAAGRYPIRVTLRDAAPGTRETVLRAGPPGEEDVLALEHGRNDDWRFVFSSPRLGEDKVGDTITVGRGRSVELLVLYDPVLHSVEVTLDGRFGEGFQWDAYASPVTVAGDGSDAASAPHFLRGARLEPAPADFCRDLVG